MSFFNIPTAFKGLIIGLAWTSSTSAECLKGEEVFMSCTVEGTGKSLDVCFTQETATYRFGTPGAAPELELSTPVAAVDYVPWPGVGSTIFETVRFTNAEYAYEVFAGFDRMTDPADADAAPHFGGVTVHRAEDVVAEVSCMPKTVDFAWGEGLFSAKQANGLVWDHAERQWTN